MTSGSTLQLRYRLQRAAFDLDVDLELPASGISGVFGPSGAGKTTLLRCIAGLERPDEALTVIAGDAWDHGDRRRAVAARPVGMVFQDTRLFPHLDVAGNLDFAARRATGTADAAAIVELMGLGDLLARDAGRLSGGEGKRVAIARALLRAPRLLLMDEPLAGLDAARRDELLPWLERLHTAAALPIVYVSHSVDELCRLADQLVVLDAGRVRANGPLREVLLAADANGIPSAEAGAVLVATVDAHDSDFGLSYLRLGDQKLQVPQVTLDPGQCVRIRVRAADVSIALSAAADSSVLNILPAEVVDIAPSTGSAVLVTLAVDGHRLLARITRKSLIRLELSPGRRVCAQLKSVAVERPVVDAGTAD